MSEPSAPAEPVRGDPFRDWDAAYVMGMLSPDDRRAFERHLATCAACTAAVAELAGLPGILGALSPAEAVALLDEPAAPERTQPDLVHQLAQRVGRRRRRTRRRMIALVAGVGAALAVAGVFAGFGFGTAAERSTPLAVATSTAAPGGPDANVAPIGDGVARAMTPVEPGGVEAELAVTEKGWGTRFDWSCSYGTGRPGYPGAPDLTYDLVVTDARGTETTVASWSAAGEAAGNLSASTSIPTAQLRAVDIRLAGSDHPLARTTF